MQYAAAVLILAGLASAAAVPRQEADSETFHITEFGFSGTPHSVTSFYSFNVSDATDGSNSIQCLTTTNTSPAITFFNTTSCSDPAWSFSWTDAGNNQSTVAISHLKDGSGSTPFVAQRSFCQNDVKLNPGITPTGETYYLDIGDTSGQFDLNAIS